MKKIFIIFSVVLILTSGCGRFDSSPYTPHFQESRISFNPALLLDKGQIGLMQPHILQDKEGILYAVWINGKTTFLSKSFDNGKSWEKQALTLGRQRSYDWWPFCFSSGSQGRLYLVQASDGIFFSYSEDKGETWSTPIQVNDDRRKFAYCQNPSFTVDDEGTLFIVYTKKKKIDEVDPWKNKEKTGLYLSKSFDGGSTWSKNVLLKDITYTEPTDFPSLLSCKDALYLAYGDFIYKSIKGKDWKKILKLKSKFGNITSIIKNDLQGNLYVIWQRAVITKKGTGAFGGGKDEGYVDICFSKSTNGGRTWMRPVHINDTKLPFEWKMGRIGMTGTEFIKKYATQETKEAIPLDLAVSRDGKIIGIIWKDWRSGKGELYFSYSLDGGKSWSKNVRVNDDFAQEIKASSLAIKEDGSVYVLWINLGPHKSVPGGYIGKVEVYFSSGKIKG